MSWDEIIEVSKEDFVFIGNHSHSHAYLENYKYEKFKKDILKSIEIFEKNMSYNSKFFSYQFGEYSIEKKKYISRNLKEALDQHTRCIDLNKNN